MLELTMTVKDKQYKKLENLGTQLATGYYFSVIEVGNHNHYHAIIPKTM